jgi:hypothetical protein
MLHAAVLAVAVCLSLVIDYLVGRADRPRAPYTYTAPTLVETC